MKTDCINYGDCRRPVQQCNNHCTAFNHTCWDCALRVGEECGIDGHEVYEYSVPCDEFERMSDEQEKR